MCYAEATCPHCDRAILVGFVRINRYCPACMKPLEVDGQTGLVIPRQKEAPLNPVPANGVTASV